MELYDGLLSRRSIRKFNSASISDEQLEKILRAGMAAPSAANKQPWHFIVVKEKKTMIGIMKIHPYAQMLEQSPIALIVCGDVEEAYQDGYMVVDTSAATQNVLLAAHALGLGAVWIGIWPEEDRVYKLTQMFNLPDNIVPMHAVAIGFPGEEKPANDRYDLHKIHQETF